MNSIREWLIKSFDEWYSSGKKTSPRGFAFRQGRKDDYIDEIEIWFIDPDGDSTPDSEIPDDEEEFNKKYWGKTSADNATEYSGMFGSDKDQQYDFGNLFEDDWENFQKIIDRY